MKTVELLDDCFFHNIEAASDLFETLAFAKEFADLIGAAATDGANDFGGWKCCRAGLCREPPGFAVGPDGLKELLSVFGQLGFPYPVDGEKLGIVPGEKRGH